MHHIIYLCWFKRVLISGQFYVIFGVFDFQMQIFHKYSELKRFDGEHLLCIGFGIEIELCTQTTYQVEIS